MVRRHELSDEEWALLEPLLPPRETRGRPFHEHRLILNGMLYWLHTGVPWRDLPERYGPWQTVYARFRRWSRDGLWDQLLARHEAYLFSPRPRHACALAPASRQCTRASIRSALRRPAPAGVA